MLSNQQSASVTISMNLVLNFTNDLPNGPYCTQNGALGFKCYIYQTGCAMDLKNLLERNASQFAPGNISSNRVETQIQSVYNVLALSYKGQNIPWDYSLSMMNNGDEVTATIAQTMHIKSKLKGVCCELI